MKKYKGFLVVLFTFLIFIFLNIVYYFIINWQTFFPDKTNLSDKIVNLKTYHNSKIGFELKYPASWIVQDDGNLIEINPPSSGGNTYFSVGLRNDFKSLDDIKEILATNIPITPIQVDNASGFEYTDSDYHKSIWLSHSNKIYIIRTYPRSEKTTKILSTFKFSN